MEFVLGVNEKDSQEQNVFIRAIKQFYFNGIILVFKERPQPVYPQSTVEVSKRYFVTIHVFHHDNFPVHGGLENRWISAHYGERLQ